MRRKQLSMLILSILVASTLVGCNEPWPTSSPSRLTILSIATGNVSVMKKGTDSWTEGQVGISLEAGDSIKTDDSSSAQITFSEGSTIDLEPGTEIEVVSLDISTETDSSTVRLKQTIGNIIFRVTKIIDPASRYEVETPAGVVAVRGSAVQIHVIEDGTTWVCNLEGDIWAIAQGVELQIPEGQCCIIRPGQPPELLVAVCNLTISSATGGSVTIPGEGTFPYNEGTVVDLVASPDAGYHFTNWTGDVDTIGDVNSATTIIIMDDDYSITANFVAVTQQYGGELVLLTAADPTYFDDAIGPHYQTTGPYECLWSGDWAKGNAGGYGTGDCDWAIGTLNRVEHKSAYIAESYEIHGGSGDDYMIFYLRDGVHWHDKYPCNGREVTADDVVFSIERQMTLDTAYLKKNYPDLAAAMSVSKVDEDTVRIDCSAEQMPTLLTMIDFMYIYPKDAVELYGDMNDWERAIGTGAFTLEEYVAGSYLYYERNPAYWRTYPEIGSPYDGDQLPYLDGVRTLIQPDPATQDALFTTGQVDILAGITYDRASTLKANNPEAEYLTYFSEGNGRVLFMRLDKEDKPWADVRVRQAMQLVIDNQLILDELYGGDGEILYWPVYPCPEYASAYVPLEDLEGDIIEVLPGETMSVADLFGYNLELAQDLMDAAGYPDGFQAQVDVYNYYIDLDSIQVVVHMLDDIGIELTINAVDYATWVTEWALRNYQDMFYGSFAGVGVYFKGINWSGSSMFNTSYIDDPVLNDYRDQMLAAYPDDDEVDCIHAEMMPYLLEQCYAIQTAGPNAYRFWWPWVKNYSGEGSVGYYKTLNPSNNYACVWIDEDLKEDMGYPSQSLTISSTCGGSVTTPGEGAYIYDEGTVVSLVAEAEEGCHFINWTGDVGTIANINAATTTITMNGSYSIVANFGWEHIAMVAAGGLHTVGLKIDGTVVAVGWNDYGQCDVGGWTDIIQVAGGVDHTAGVKCDGTVVAVGDNDAGQCNVAAWTDIIQVAGGGSHTVGVNSDGTVVAAGWNDWGQCNVTGWTDITQVAAGSWHTVGLKSDGTVVAVGLNGSGQCNVTGWTDITQVAAGLSHTVGLKPDGSVVAVGANWYGQCEVADWTDITQVAAGGLHTVGLKADGTVVAVGWNDHGQRNVGGWTDIIQVAAGSYRTVGLKSDGSVVAVGDNDPGQCEVDGWTDITQVATFRQHTVGLKSDGAVVAVGRNLFWECNVSGWGNITQVAAGLFHTVGLKLEGTVVAVGDNYHGQCDVGNWTDIVQVAAGELHTVGLKSDGTVVAAGSNYIGECNVAGWTSITQVAAGEFHTVGLKSDGTVVATGSNYQGQCNVGGWTNIVQVAAGRWHTVGVKSDGTVVATGSNYHGQCDLDGWTNITQVAAGLVHTVGLKSNGTVVAVGAETELPTWDLF